MAGTAFLIPAYRASNCEILESITAADLVAKYEEPAGMLSGKSNQ